MGRLDLLAELFEEVLVPPAVRDEVLAGGGDRLGMTAIRGAFTTDQLIVHAVTDRGVVADLTRHLHRGEAEAIALMQEMGRDLLLLDDRVARVHAQAGGLAVSGTVGILRMARERGLIQRVGPIVGELQRLGFRISGALVQVIQQEEQ